MVTYNGLLVMPLYGRAGCRIVTRPLFLSTRVGSGHETSFTVDECCHIVVTILRQNSTNVKGECYYIWELQLTCWLLPLVTQCPPPIPLPVIQVLRFGCQATSNKLFTQQV